MNICFAPCNKNWLYTVKIEDENFQLENFKKRFSFNEEDFNFLNPNITSLKAGDVLIMPPCSQYFHIVGPLETYKSIATMFNTTPENLIETNKTVQTFVGQRIYIWHFIA